MNDNREKQIENLILDNYERYYKLAYSYVHNEADALDIVQEGAYKAILRCETLKDSSFANTWIYRIMLNEIFLFCRRNKQITMEDYETLNLSQEDFSYEKEKDIMLQEALNNLPDKEKAIVELRYFEDLKLEEISDILGENLSTVKSRLYRALDKLKVSMAE